MKKESLIGQKFGMLTVIKEAPKHGEKIWWYCICECGNKTEAPSDGLKSGRRWHCGCQKPLHPGNYIDLTGKRFGTLTVIGRTDPPSTVKNKEKAYWLCKCDCGQLHITSGDSLKAGNCTNCGCQKSLKMKTRFTKDLTGKRFGRLTVIKQVNNYISPNGFTNTQWLCECDCGNYTTVTHNSLTSGNTQSCGCLAKEKASNRTLNNLIGMRFGKLFVRERTDNLIHPCGTYSVQYICDCDCGNTVVITSGNLSSGHTMSCGCLSSKTESLIGNILKSYTCDYKTQYIFEDCVYIGKLRFDFAVFKNQKLIFLLEYDGQQHSEIVNFSGDKEKAKKDFEALQVRDRIKDKYCADHNIPLYRIDYKENNHIEETLNSILNQYNIQKYA